MQNESLTCPAGLAAAPHAIAREAEAVPQAGLPQARRLQQIGVADRHLLARLDGLQGCSGTKTCCTRGGLRMEVMGRARAARAGMAAKARWRDQDALVRIRLQSQMLCTLWRLQPEKLLRICLQRRQRCSPAASVWRRWRRRAGTHMLRWGGSCGSAETPACEKHCKDLVKLAGDALLLAQLATLLLCFTERTAA